jgi:hypothetical protein
MYALSHASCQVRWGWDKGSGDATHTENLTNSVNAQHNLSEGTAELVDLDQSVFLHRKTLARSEPTGQTTTNSGGISGILKAGASG